jgi:hypothetical protein
MFLKGSDFVDLDNNTISIDDTTVVDKFTVVESKLQRYKLRKQTKKCL